MSAENKVIHNQNRRLNNLFYKLFPLLPGVNFSKLLITEEGIYSISKPRDSEVISERISQMLGEDIVITDATANVGGNCINFANKFKSVNAVELDSLNYDVLTKNLKVYGLDSRVKCVHGNYLGVFDKLKQDVIFIDPPWGGRSYKNVKVLDLVLKSESGGEIYIGNIVLRLLSERLAKMVVVKVPYNFSFDKFEKMLDVYKIDRYAIEGYFILQVYFRDISKVKKGYL